MFSKSEARRCGDVGVDAPPSWWEGWPLTVVAVLFAAAHYWALGAAVWRLFSN